MLGAIGSALSGFAGGIEARRDREQRVKDKAQQDRMLSLWEKYGAAPPRMGAVGTRPEKPAPRGGKSGGSGKVDPRIRDGIFEAATELGIAPEDLATAISYETGGTFDPMQRGPTTQWGEHIGLIQFGEPQRAENGVDLSTPGAAITSQLGRDGAIVRYLRRAGVKPGMGMLDVYSAINAGRVGRYGASDANNGGAPGTVRDRVENQMAGHRQNALALFAVQPMLGAR
jgi:hypothetical protein